MVRNNALDFLYATTNSPGLAAKLRMLRKMNKQLETQRSVAFDKFMYLSTLKEKKQNELKKLRKDVKRLSNKRDEIMNICRYDHRRRCGESKPLTKKMISKNKKIAELVKKIKDINKKLSILNNNSNNYNNSNSNSNSNGHSNSSNCGSNRRCRNSQCSNCMRHER